ncbi:hypothetical protein ACLOAU_05430 [Niabella sp. CJ426]|uniref:hypothetical protein n=1 Tax=Niabella sp. CJ426 TaxID=3393740 RepID=UPI003D090D07
MYKTKKHICVFIAFFLALMTGCSKKETLTNDHLKKAAVADRGVNEITPKLIASSSSTASPFSGAYMELFQTTSGYYVQVSFTYNSSISRPATICLSSGASSSDCISTMLSAGGNVFGFNVPVLTHGTTLELQITVTSSNSITSTYSVAKSFVYLPVYESSVRLQELPEFIDCYPNYTVSSSWPYFHVFSAYFTWPEEYRSDEKYYTFNIEVGNYNASTGIFTPLNLGYAPSSALMSAKPSQGEVFVSLDFGAMYHNISSRSSFHYRFAVYENGANFSGYYYVAPPLFWFGYGPNVLPLKIKVLKQTSSGMLYE